MTVVLERVVETVEVEQPRPAPEPPVQIDPRPIAIDAVAEHFRSLLAAPAVQACPGILELLATVGSALVLRLPHSDDPCEVFPEIEAAFQARRASGRQPRDVFTRWLRAQVERAGGALTIAQIRTLLLTEAARPLAERWVLSVEEGCSEVVYRSGHRQAHLYAAELSQRLYRAREFFRKRHNANRCGD